MINEYAPIVLFVYNRPEHTRRLLESLNRNPEAKDSDLFVFCDGPKDSASEQMREQIGQVHTVVQQTAKCRSLTVYRSEKNRGLAPSVIAGVSRIVEQYGRVIVLEDDLILSVHFLKYMNDALELYKDNPKVSCVTGYVPPHVLHLPDTFFLRNTHCWGWATWKRAWQVFEPDGKKLMERLKTSGEISHLSYNDTYDYVGMLQDQIDGKNSSWYIRWLVSTYLAGMYCLYPSRPLDINDGLDGTGTHCEAVQKQWHPKLVTRPVRVEPQPVQESKAGYGAYCYYNTLEFHSNPLRRVIRKVWKTLGLW